MNKIMTKNNLVKKVLNGVKKAVVYSALTALPFIYSGKAGAQNQDYQKVDFQILTTTGEIRNAQKIDLHGNEYIVVERDATRVDSGKPNYEIWPLPACGYGNEIKPGAIVKIKPGLIYLPQLVKLDEHEKDENADQVTLNPKGNFPMPGKPMSTGNTLITGESNPIDPSSLENKIYSIKVGIAQEEFFYPFYPFYENTDLNQVNPAQAGQKLNFIFVPVNSGNNKKQPVVERFIDYKGNFNFQYENNIWEWVLDSANSDKEMIKDLEFLAKVCVNSNYDKPTENQNTGEVIKLGEWEYKAPKEKSGSTSQKESTAKSNLKARISGDGGLNFNSLGTIGPNGSLAIQFGIGKDAYFGFYGGLSGVLSGKKDEFQNPETKELIHQTNPIMNFVTQGSGSDELKVWSPYEFGIAFSKGIAEGKGEIDIRAGVLAEKSLRKVITQGTEYTEINGVKDLSSVKDYSSNVLHEENTKFFDGGYKFAVGGKVYLGNSPFYAGFEASFTKTGLKDSKSYGSLAAKMGCNLPRNRTY